MRENVDVTTAVLHTDSFGGCFPTGRKMIRHFVVNHSAGYYATDMTCGTNL